MSTVTQNHPTILLVDDDEQHLSFVKEVLSALPLRICIATSPRAALEVLEECSPSIALLDLKLPEMSGIELLQRILALSPSTEVILMTGHYTPESAVEAIQKGASDYLAKPLKIDALRDKITSIIEDQANRQRLRALSDEIVHSLHFDKMIGHTEPMLQVFSKIKRVAPHYRTALITGATGTGKELVAEALHALSPTKNRTFAVCNCSALSETLFESELFGYVRGAFTGAQQDKVGLFEFANGGTVFLDEIGDMPLAGQAKLLRVLQNQEIQRVGSPQVRRVDVRVIAATNRNLKQMVAAGTFREDLYYRLSMVNISLPSLADRRADIPFLTRHFIERFSTQFGKPIEGISKKAQQILNSYSWPGNVRELENVIGGACMMLADGEVDVADLPAHLFRTDDYALGDLDVTLEEIQRKHARRTLARLNGNKAKAAQVLGISRVTLYKLLAADQAPKAEPSGV